MKFSHYIRTAFTLFVSTNVFGQLGTISGHIYDRLENKGMESAIVFLVGTKKGTITDFQGNFRIDSIAPGIYDVKCSEVSSGDTTFKITVVADSITTFEAILPPYCKYESHEKDKTCPKCKKRDKVVPMVYGLPIGPLNKKRYYYAGCNISHCDPNWYCKRDKFKF